jgi:hypothetical protein
MDLRPAALHTNGDSIVPSPAAAQLPRSHPMRLRRPRRESPKRNGKPPRLVTPPLDVQPRQLCQNARCPRCSKKLSRHDITSEQIAARGVNVSVRPPSPLAPSPPRPVAAQPPPAMERPDRPLLPHRSYATKPPGQLGPTHTGPELSWRPPPVHTQTAAVTRRRRPSQRLAGHGQAPGFREKGASPRRRIKDVSGFSASKLQPCSNGRCR